MELNYFLKFTYLVTDFVKSGSFLLYILVAIDPFLFIITLQDLPWKYCQKHIVSPPLLTP